MHPYFNRIRHRHQDLLRDLSSNPHLDGAELNSSGKALEIKEFIGKKRDREESSALAVPKKISLSGALYDDIREQLCEIIEERNSLPSSVDDKALAKYRSPFGVRLVSVCPYVSVENCIYNQREKQEEDFDGKECDRLHFRKVILPQTDLNKGDCSFLDTCRSMNTCKRVHYKMDASWIKRLRRFHQEIIPKNRFALGCLYNIQPYEHQVYQYYPAQWMNCDLRKVDLSIFQGQISVVMADPPWDIHMDLPYGTMRDEEMKNLKVSNIQTEGVIFLWVTSRALELGRECMSIWGYKRVDELLWLKTNQLQKIVRTGRTGHWLNHSKEHCIIGVKTAKPNDNKYTDFIEKLNRNLDTDIIVSEVRETSRKPDEIYRIIERISPGTTKLELFGRIHNTRVNWITLGNQLESVRITNPVILERYNQYALSNDLPLAELYMESNTTL